MPCWVGLWCSASFSAPFSGRAQPLFAVDLGATPEDLCLCVGCGFFAFAGDANLPVGWASGIQSGHARTRPAAADGGGGGAALFCGGQRSRLQISNLAMVLIGIGCAPVLWRPTISSRVEICAGRFVVLGVCHGGGRHIREPRGVLIHGDCG